MGAKETVGNELEVQEGEGPKGKVWHSIIQDYARLEKWLDEEEPMPGKQFVHDYFPKAEEGKDRMPEVKYAVLIGNHPAALAQQTHWDQLPFNQMTDVDRTKDQ